MFGRLHRLFAAFLLVVLPWQGFAGASMLSCARATAPAQQSTADLPCHEAATHHSDAATPEAPSNLDGWTSCGGCAQCHACSASVLPMAAPDTPVAPPLRPAFTAPAAIAGVVLEHLDPPPVG
jgi:hypothetical protein